MDKKCTVCDKMYFAKRADSKFCTPACRKRSSRMGDDLKPETKDEQPAEKKPMTQEEIEAHYTLKNFPPVKYYSTNGGGNGSYSPYPASDPRSKAYSLV